MGLGRGFRFSKQRVVFVMLPAKHWEFSGTFRLIWYLSERNIVLDRSLLPRLQNRCVDSYV